MAGRDQRLRGGAILRYVHALRELGYIRSAQPLSERGATRSNVATVAQTVDASPVLPAGRIETSVAPDAPRVWWQVLGLLRPQLFNATYEAENDQAGQYADHNGNRQFQQRSGQPADGR
jgi:hypothetical protein